MANPDARRAVSLAIDREAINEGVFQGSLTPASALLPPPFGDVHQDGVCGDCTFDVAKAKDLAAKGGLTPGTPLRLLYNNDGGHEALVQAWKDQLERNLGVVVTLDGVPFAESLLKRDAGDFDIARASWGCRLPDDRELPVPHPRQPVGGQRQPLQQPPGRRPDPAAAGGEERRRPAEGGAGGGEDRHRPGPGRHPHLLPDPVPGLRCQQVDGRQARLLRAADAGHHQPQGLTPVHGLSRSPRSPWPGTSSDVSCKWCWSCSGPA